LQLAAIALNFGVLVSAVYEGIYARRGGDPTKIRVVSDRAATINNPGYREYHQPTNGKAKKRKRKRERDRGWMVIKFRIAMGDSTPVRVSIDTAFDIGPRKISLT